MPDHSTAGLWKPLLSWLVATSWLILSTRRVTVKTHDAVGTLTDSPLSWPWWWSVRESPALKLASLMLESRPCHMAMTTAGVAGFGAVYNDSGMVVSGACSLSLIIVHVTTP